MSAHPPLELDAAGVHAYLAEVWPEEAAAYEDGAIVELRPGHVRFHKRTSDRDLRPGGTVSGPTMMTAVDQACYVLVLGHLGPAALAVTSHLAIEFLRRPRMGALVVDVELLKLGRTQVVMAARLTNDVDEPGPPVATATVVYSRALVGPPGEGVRS